MRKTSLAFLLIFVVVLSGCATLFTKGGAAYRSGERSFRDGKYDQAASSALEALGKNPEFPEAKDLLERAVKEGTDGSLARIESLKASGDRFAYDRIWPVYSMMDRLHQVISASAFATNYSTRGYQDELAQAKETASEAHYKAGNELLAKGGFRNARKAAQQFHAVLEVSPNYKDSSALAKKASRESVATVVVYSKQGMFGFEDEVFNAAAASAIVRQQNTSVSAASLGLSAGLDPATVISRARGRADFVVYIDMNLSSETQPLESVKGEPFNGTVTTSIMRISYRRNISGAYAMYEVAGGKTLLNEKINDTASDKIEYTLLKATRLEEINLGEGKKGYTVFDQQDIYAVVDCLNESKKVTQNYDEASIGAISDYRQLKNLVNGKIFNYDTEFVKDPVAERYYNAFADDLQENHRLKNKNVGIFGRAIPNAMRKLAAAEAEKFDGDVSSLAARIGKALQKALR